MTNHATGNFEVNVAPQGEPDQAEGLTLGRMSLDKQFRGDLEGTGKGQMLTSVSDGGSAVYVAVERVTGTLQGRSGSFILVHQGAMSRESQHLSIHVMAGSGTGELQGLTGTFAITITDGKHLYDFDYKL